MPCIFKSLSPSYLFVNGAFLSARFIDYLNSLTELPWNTVYSQTDGAKHNEDSMLHMYALALTIVFTIAVFRFEHMLDTRQAEAYKITTFPEQLAKTVSKIDESAALEKQNADNKDDAGTAEAVEEKKDGDEKKLDKDKPILPQLKDKFIKAQLYGTDKINFGMISAMYNTLETVIFLVIGFLPYTWDLSVRISANTFGWEGEEENEIKISLVFLFLNTILGTITGLPFELYSTFKIEKKHGFNKQTLGLFFSDKVKSLLLTCVIGGPFVSILLKIIKWGGDHFYIYVWGFMFLFSSFMMTIAPTVIMPLFNKYEPLPDSELKTKIYALADRLNYPLQKLFVMDGSKRSSHSNAFMFGFGKNKRIVLFDTLMKQVSDDEVVGILGHELGHWKLGHTLSNFVITQLYFGASFYGFSLCYKTVELYQAFGFDGVDRPIPTIIALLLFFQTLWAPVDKILSFMQTMHSRKCEFEADEFSGGMGMSQELQTGLCKISLENLGALCPDPWYAKYHYSHPPLVERLSAMIESHKKASLAGKKTN